MSVRIQPALAALLTTFALGGAIVAAAPVASANSFKAHHGEGIGEYIDVYYDDGKDEFCVRHEKRGIVSAYDVRVIPLKAGRGTTKKFLAIEGKGWACTSLANAYEDTPFKYELHTTNWLWDGEKFYS